MQLLPSIAFLLVSVNPLCAAPDSPQLAMSGDLKVHPREVQPPRPLHLTDATKPPRWQNNEVRRRALRTSA